MGAQTLDHIAIPVRDLPRSEKFYQETIGLKFMTTRKNSDGSPRYAIALDSRTDLGSCNPTIASRVQRRTEIRLNRLSF